MDQYDEVNDDTDNDWYQAPPTSSSGRRGNRFDNIMGSGRSHMISRKRNMKSLKASSSNVEDEAIMQEPSYDSKSPTPQVQEDEVSEDDQGMDEEVMDDIEEENQENTDFNGSRTNLFTSPTPELVTPSSGGAAAGGKSNPFRVSDNMYNCT